MAIFYITSLSAQDIWRISVFDFCPSTVADGKKFFSIVYSKDDYRMLPVTVHVLVAENITANGHQYLIEEQVQFIEGKRVEQVDVKVLSYTIYGIIVICSCFMHCVCSFACR